MKVERRYKALGGVKIAVKKILIRWKNPEFE